MKARPIKAPPGYFPAALQALEGGNYFLTAPDEALLQDRALRFDQQKRLQLCEVIRRQYADVQDFAGSVAASSLDKLAQADTFTVTTGQQIHLFLGPLYVVYKIADTILKAREYAERWPDKHVVPVFWMATEDHDFEEIARVQAFGSEWRWERSHGGPVGKLTLEGLEPLLQALDARISDPQARPKWEALREIYQNSDNLASATRKVVHAVFGHYGLLCIDPDDPELKQQFRSDMQLELLHGTYSNALQRGTGAMAAAGISAAAAVRDPNLFMLDAQGMRRRIARSEGGFTLFPGEESVAESELSRLLQEEPERFSPNVVLRPLYQERILPNLAYVAGPSEFIYWCQTRQLFNEAGMAAPALVRRRSFIVPDAKSAAQMEKLDIPDEWWWLGDDVFRTHLMDRAGEVNPFPGLRERWIALIEETAAVLHAGRDPGLKAFRNSSGDLLNQLKKSSNNYADSLENHPQWGAMLRQALKIKQRYFSPALPQERTEWSFDFLLKENVLLDYLTSSHFANQDFCVVF